MNSLWKFALLACLMIGAVVADNHGDDHGDDHDDADAGAEGEKTCLTECVVPTGLPTGEDAEYSKDVCDKVKMYLDCLKTNELCKDDDNAKNILEQMKDTPDKCKEVSGDGNSGSIAKASVLLTGLAVFFARW